MRGLACALVVVWLAATACSLHQSSSAATGARTGPVGSPLAPASGALDAEVAMPAGFPTDFPIYPHARLTAAAPFASTGQVAWGMEWETVDAQAKVQAFYAQQLKQGDWVLTVSPTPSAQGQFAGTFTRKTDKNVDGTIAVNSDPPLAKILVSLVYPA